MALLIVALLQRIWLMLFFQAEDGIRDIGVTGVQTCALPISYDVRYPKMPDEDRPEYEAWKNQIAKEITALDGEVVLVGHSLGASILLKYLSEEKVGKAVAGIFLIASPYWGAEDWQVSEYKPQEDFASKLPNELPMFFYHSRDDEVVPFAHLALYKEKTPAGNYSQV